MQIEVNDAEIFDTWVKGAIGRRDKWSSRYVINLISARASVLNLSIPSEEATKLYKAAPSFSYWDPAVIEAFIKYGVTEDPSGPSGAVKLKGPVWLVSGFHVFSFG